MLRFFKKLFCVLGLGGDRDVFEGQVVVNEAFHLEFVVWLGAGV